jgi:hypothetical protein
MPKDKRRHSAVEDLFIPKRRRGGKLTRDRQLLKETDEERLLVDAARLLTATEGMECQ